MSDGRTEVVVHVDASDLGPDRPVGLLRRARKGTIIDLSFAYDAAWLMFAGAFDLDPALSRYEGDQRTRHGGLHGIFADTAPDRWGRLLLERREAQTARREGRRARTLDEWDFLLGVSDELRMGALRLARPDNGQFLEHGPRTVPPLARLRELQHYAERAERGDELGDRDAEDEVALLIAPGSSLGGARPKANFRGDDGALWIAKFPSREDRRDMGAWEYVLNRLAATAGIAVPATQLLELRSGYRTFCGRRFDRVRNDRRLFASAMTLAQKRNGEAASYLDIVEAIEDHGDPKAIEEDLEQLFRRAVFAVLAAHRDDHLRNHAFLRTPQGWRLAPAFDLNPLPDKPEHTIAFDDRLRVPDLGLVLETAKYYRLSGQHASAIVDEVRAAVAPWRERARELGVPRDEIELMAAVIES